MSTLPATIPVKELRSYLSDITDEVARGRRFVVTRNKKPRMALIPIADLELLKALEDEADQKAIRSRAKEPLSSWDDVKARLGI